MSVLASSAYRRLWAARTVSQCGDIAQFTVASLLVFHLTRSGLGVSGMVIAEIVPVVLLAPLAGPLVDRLSRVPVMVAADLARMALAAILAAWHGDVAVVYAVSFGLSAGAVFFNPASGSLLPALVKDDDLVAANSGIWSAAVLSQVLLAPLAGLLTQTAGYGWAFAANAASFAISALLLSGLRASETPKAGHGHQHPDPGQRGIPSGRARPAAARARRGTGPRGPVGRGDQRPAGCPGGPAAAHLRRRVRAAARRHRRGRLHRPGPAHPGARPPPPQPGNHLCRVRAA